jgi:hypothetical protein
MEVIIFITSEQRLSYQESPFFSIISRGTTYTIHIHFNSVLFNPLLPAFLRCTDL